MKTWMIVTALVLLSACTNMTKEAKDAAAAAKRAQYETQEAWRKLLTYTPPPEPQLAQRRYCYKQIADVVCYDSPQNTTSPLVAIQEGNPGRVIAGKIAYEKAQNTHQPTYAENRPSSVNMTPSSPTNGEVVTFGVAPAPSVQQRDLAPIGVDGKCKPGGAFACKESGYVPGAKVGK